MAVKNIQVSNELLTGLQARAAPEQALRVGIEAQRDLRDLNDLISWGESHARERGHKPSDVERAITAIRRSR